jgi:hypothetical protein
VTLLVTFDDGTQAIGPDDRGRWSQAETLLSLVPRPAGFRAVGMAASMLIWPLTEPRPAPSEPEPAEPDENIGMCAEGTLWFIGPRHASFREVDDGACGERDTGSPRDIVVSLEEEPSARAAVPIGTLLGRDAATAAARAARIVDATPTQDLDVESGDPPAPATEWRIGRARGRWHVSDIELGVPVDRLPDWPLVLPGTLVGHDALRPSWRIIKEQVPDAIDAFAAPWGDLLVVRTPDRTVVMRVHGERLDQITAFRSALPTYRSRRVIAVNWARGSSAPRWVQTVAARR